ncbi:MAG: hypothetical protein QOI80_498 [Solirubrobacteraceae bacterium]|jgi:uncharacterized protein YkwD|nr:hypothetical protein [Solirubrobacteraceae bacterium]
MRTLVLALAAIAVAAPVAQAGKPIKPRPQCPDMNIRYSNADAGRFRDAVLCLMSAVREDQKLNALKDNAKLRKAGQRWANHLGKTGETTHGKSVAEIPRRIAKAGYRASAVNEGLGLDGKEGTPYGLVASMMTDFACTEILDPRFRDAGVGVNRGKLKGFGRGIHVVVEFGLKRNAKPPRTNRGPADSCGHRLPPAQTSPVSPAGPAPEVHDTDITIEVQCYAERACAFDATLKLVHAKAKSTLHTDSLAPGQTTELVFPFAADDLRDERGNKHPGIDVHFVSTKPYAFEDTFSAGI